jgi:hypothetical protein
MTFSEFDKFHSKLINDVFDMRNTKGKEYANSNDRFDNFNRLARKLGINRLQAANVYLTKHLDAIDQYCRTEQTHSTEGIYGRIVDAITYLSLIAGMIEETKRGGTTRNDTANECTAK